MIEKTIDIGGYQFVKRKMIKGQKHKYVEYRNTEVSKVKSFEIDTGKIQEKYKK